MYNKILVAIDGSRASLAGGNIALKLAATHGSTIVAVNVFDAQIHTRRFNEMETILPGQYREDDSEEQLREVHNVWTNEGFLALSKKRIAPYLAMCRNAGIEPVEINRQGRNYVELIESANEEGVDLIVMGAAGLGALNGDLGSTAARVLRGASCDVLLVRKELNGGGVMVGIDGSEEAMHALERAEALSEVFNGDLALAAVYDPYFHNRVLESLEEASSTYETSYHSHIYKAVEEHGDSQNYGGAHTAVKEKESEGEGHDQMVDEGLARLYDSFLTKAEERISSSPRRQLLKGKPYQQLADYGKEITADLIVVGRNGLHKTDESSLGSNAEGALRLSDTNFLVVRN